MAPSSFCGGANDKGCSVVDLALFLKRKPNKLYGIAYPPTAIFLAEQRFLAAILIFNLDSSVGCFPILD